MPQDTEELEILPIPNEELEILPTKKTEESTKKKNKYNTVLPVVGAVQMLMDPDRWYNKSIFGIESPPASRLFSKDVTSDDIQKAGASMMTTPLTLAGEAAAGLGLISKFRGAKKVPIPEVLPPEAPPPRRIAGLLEAPKDPFIGGPGGVLRRSKINPQEEARLLGYDPLRPGTTVDMEGISFNPQEAIEKMRQQGLRYTGHEQAGGTALTIKDRPLTDIPAQQSPFGEHRLGFSEVSRSSDLPYPLNVVPSSVMPRSTQTVTRALTGDLKPPVKTEPITFVNEKVPKIATGETLARDLRGGTAAIEPGEAILPSAIKASRAEVNKVAADLKITPEAIEAAEVSAPPPVKAAINQVVKEQAAARPYDLKSVYQHVREESEPLYQKSAKEVHIDRQQKAEWIPPLEEAGRKMTTQERANFGAYVEGTDPIPSPAVQHAVTIWKAVEDAIGDRAIGVGLRMFPGEGPPIPFQKNPNYWPRFPLNEIPKKTLIDRLMKRGMTRHEALRVEAHYRKEGELKLGAQHTRTKEDFPYKLDFDIALNHARSMSKRIAQHEAFGPLDVKGKGAEGIADLIEATPNSKKTLKLMERIIGRDEKAEARLTNVLNKARKFSTYTKLQTFSVPNVILGAASNSLKASRYPMESFKEVTKLLSSRYRNEIQAAGVWQDFAVSLAEELKPGKDVYGIGLGEKINRGIAGAIGRAVASSSFKTLKANPLDKLARRELSELLLTNVDDVMKQTELNPEQLKLAAGRAAEQTQSLNVPGNLPYSWSEPVTGVWPFIGQLALIFKKTGYQQTRFMYNTISDAFKASPVQGSRALAAWIAATGVAGELVGDVKQGIRGAWTGTAGERVEDRGNFWLESSGLPKKSIEKLADVSGVEPELIARLFDNYMQAFFLGLPADMIMSGMYGPAGMTAAAAGPVIGEASKIGSRLIKGDLKGLGKDIVRDLPIIGGTAGPIDRLYED